MPGASEQRVQGCFALGKWHHSCAQSVSAQLGQQLDQQPLGGSLAGAVAIEGDEQLLGAMALQELEL